MISTGEVVVEKIAVAQGHGESLEALAIESSRVVLGSVSANLESSRVVLGSVRANLESSRVVLGSSNANSTLKKPSSTLADANLKYPGTTLDDANLKDPGTTLDDANLKDPVTTLDGANLKDTSSTLDDAKSTLKDPNTISGVVAATFSNPNRFPSLAVKVAAALGLPASTPAFDIQMACSAYPYALYVAGKLAQDTGGKVLVVDGDVQSPFVDKGDHATGSIFSDACTASIVSCGGKTDARSYFDFLSRADDALKCPGAGPISMDGFAVFSFVATEVSKFLSLFLDGVAASADFDPRSLPFAPHQANPYMVRRLADALGLAENLITIPEELKNPGSCSVPMALAMKGRPGRIVIAGFGAGYSASSAVIRLGEGFVL